MKKYNFDMIEKFPEGATTNSNLYCSLTCLTTHATHQVKLHLNYGTNEDVPFTIPSLTPLSLIILVASKTFSPPAGQVPRRLPLLTACDLRSFLPRHPASSSHTAADSYADSDGQGGMETFSLKIVFLFDISF